MLLTPSSTSSAVAGAGFWAVMWSVLFKSNHLPGLKHVFPRDKVLDWVGSHKIETLIVTEVVNMSTHSGTLGVTFALGGTVINTLVIMVLFPLRGLLRTKSRKEILMGRHKCTS
jgi:hypothetical protein